MFNPYIDELGHERRNSIASAMELRLSCINPLILSSIHFEIMKNTYIHWVTVVSTLEKSDYV